MNKPGEFLKFENKNGAPISAKTRKSFEVALIQFKKRHRPDYIYSVRSEENEKGDLVVMYVYLMYVPGKKLHTFETQEEDD